MKQLYKSPLKKLVVFFENSRDQWKIKCVEAKKKIKLQRNRIQFLEDSKKALKDEVARLNKIIMAYHSGKVDFRSHQKNENNTKKKDSVI